MHTRRQYAVGQGGFHLGELVAPGENSLIHQGQGTVEIFANRKFNYVYDCGSRQHRRCRFVIDRVARSLPERRIDLLFLSHFDDDHVNGVPDLLGVPHGIKVDTIVMPWVDDVERLISFGRSYSKRSATSAFFRGLVTDPTGALSSFRPGRIIFLRGPPEDLDADLGRPVFIGPDGMPDRPFIYKVSPDPSAKSGASRGAPAGRVSRVGNADVVEVEESAIIETGATGSDLSWLFKPYVRRVEPALVLSFERHAEHLLGWAWGSFRSAVSSASVRAKLVGDPVQSRLLAKAYKLAFKDRNLTSMCLYSGPTPESRTDRLFVRLNLSGKCSWAQKIGWIGTGDAALAQAQDERDFLTRYRTETNSVITLSLPHHGSKRNYSSGIVGVLSPATCLACAKPPKNWQHPHPDVIADVIARLAQPRVVNDDDASSFEETFAMIG